jgi:hypothetical protein
LGEKYTEDPKKYISDQLSDKGWKMK